MTRIIDRTALRAQTAAAVHALALGAAACGLASIAAAPFVVTAVAG